MSGVWLASYVVLWVLLLIMGFLLAGALRQLGLIQLRLGDDPGALITDMGLERGTLAPDFTALEAGSGEDFTFSSLPNRPRVLVFLSTSCLSCRELVPGLNEVQATRGREYDFLVVCRGDLESCRSFGRMNRLHAPMVVDVNGQVEKDYDINVTPFAYLLDHERRVVIRGIANDWRQLESLIEQEGTLQGGRGFTALDEDDEAALAALEEQAR